MKNKTKKYLVSVEVLIIVLLIFNCAYSFELSSVIDRAATFENHAINNATGNRLDAVIGLTMAAQAIGTIIAICAGIIIGINFMKNGAEGKADMKQSLTPYCIGVVILYGAFGIWSATVNVLQGELTISSGNVGGYTQIITERKQYVIRPINATPIKEQEQYQYNNVDGTENPGGGSGNQTGIDWDKLSGEDQEFINNVINSVTNQQVKNVLQWAKSRLGCRYEGNGKAGSRTHGTSYDSNIELPFTNSYTCASSNHCGFDCSAFTSRAYYSMTNGSVFPGTNSHPPTAHYQCTSEARSGGYMDVLYESGFSGSKYSYNANRVKITKLKDYLKPGDLLYGGSKDGNSSRAGHTMIFVGFKGDTAMVIDASSGKSRVIYRRYPYGSGKGNVGAVIRPINW